MKKVLKKYLGAIVPVLIILAGVGVLASYEMYFKDTFGNAEIVVAKDNIEFKDKITEEDLEVRKVRTDNVVEGAYKPHDMEVILNNYASISISQGSQIYPSLIDSYDLIPNEEEGEFIAPIPTDWLFAVPGSLRSAYVADIYAVPSDEQAIIQSLEEQGEQQSGDNNEEEAEEGEGPLDTDEQTDALVQNNLKPILNDVRVSSVKDNSNQEVVNSTENDQATGTISNIEIVANQNMLNKLSQKSQEGYKFYIVYKFERQEK